MSWPRKAWGDGYILAGLNEGCSQPGIHAPKVCEFDRPANFSSVWLSTTFWLHVARPVVA